MKTKTKRGAAARAGAPTQLFEVRSCRVADEDGSGANTVVEIVRWELADNDLPSTVLFAADVRGYLLDGDYDAAAVERVTSIASFGDFTEAFVRARALLLSWRTPNEPGEEEDDLPF